MRLTSLLFLLIVLSSCSKNKTEVQFSSVDIDGFSINQLPHLNDGYNYDPNFGEEPDVFVVIRNHDGLIFEVTSTEYNVQLQDMPVEYWWTSLSPLPDYRDEIVFEFYDEDSDDHELIGRLSLHPFNVQVENGVGYFDVSQGELSIHGTMIFHE